MLLVKTKIGPSKIHGIGLFAAEFIRKGTLVWEFTRGIDLEFTEQQIGELPLLQREQILRYSYVDPYKPGIYMFCADDARFVNHTIDDQTLCDGGLTRSIATRDIEAGEELTCDYRVNDLDYRYKLEPTHHAT